MDSGEFFTFHQSDLQSTSYVALQDMRKREQLCDLTIEAGDKSISAHKVILAAAIPYFRTLFTSPGDEDGEKDIGNLDPEALDSLIDFAYTSEVSMCVDNAHSLLLAADFLQLNQVKDACVEFLAKRINTSNVLQVRKLALRLNILKLMEKSDNYIRQNFESFSKSDDFMNLSHSHLKEIISRDDLNVPCEEMVFEAVMTWVKVWPSERNSKLPELLSEVRMVFLPTDYLIKKVSSEELIRNSFCCRDLIQNVQSYHLLSTKDSSSLGLKTQPRKRSVIKNAIYTICSSGTEVYSIYCCDIRNENWNKLSSKTIEGDSFQCAIATDLNIYVFFQNTIYTFDIQTHAWNMLEPSHDYLDGAAVMTHGRIIYFFGSTGGGFGNKVRSFDTKIKKWRPEGQMTRRRSHCAAVSLGEGIYVIGGLYYADEILDTVERYCPLIEEWSECCSMLTYRYLHGCARMNGKIYVCGGMTDSGPCFSAEVYDPLIDFWCSIPSMRSARRCFSLVACDNKIYALGGVGSEGKFSDDCEIYASNWQQWKSGFYLHKGFKCAVAI